MSSQRNPKRKSALVPRTDKMFDRVGGFKVFSKVDLKTGFYQVMMKPNDFEKMAFNSNYGQFEYLFVPIGVYNALPTF